MNPEEAQKLVNGLDITTIQWEEISNHEVRFRVYPFLDLFLQVPCTLNCSACQREWAELLRDHGGES